MLNHLVKIEEANQLIYDHIVKVRELSHDGFLNVAEKNKKIRYYLNRILDNTVSHFVEVEYFMEIYRYPDRKACKKAHRNMEHILIDIYRSFQKKGQFPIEAPLGELEEWWRYHSVILNQVFVSRSDVPLVSFPDVFIERTAG